MNLFSYWRPWAADAMINSIDLILLNQIELNHLLVAAMPLTSPAFAVHCSFRKLKFTSWTCNSYAAAVITVIIILPPHSNSIASIHEANWMDEGWRYVLFVWWNAMHEENKTTPRGHLLQQFIIIYGINSINP